MLPISPSWRPPVVDHDGGLAAIGEAPVAAGDSPHPSTIEIPRDVAPVARIARPASAPTQQARRRTSGADGRARPGSARTRSARAAVAAPSAGGRQMPSLPFITWKAMLPTRREDGYTRTSRVVMRGNTPWCGPFRSPVLCPVSGARRGAGAPAQRIDSRYARRVTRRSTPSLARMLLR